MLIHRKCIAFIFKTREMQLQRDFCNYALQNIKELAGIVSCQGMKFENSELCLTVNVS